MRCFLGGAFGILPGRLVGTEALGFEVEAAKPEFAGLRIVGHQLELAARVIVLAFDEGGLRFEQVDQRLLVGADQSAGAGGHLAGKIGIARAGSDQAGRKRLVATVALAGAEITGDGVRREPDGAYQPDGDQHGCDQRDQERCGAHQAHLDELTLPDERKFTRSVREPREAEAETKHDQDENQNADHIWFPQITMILGRRPKVINVIVFHKLERDAGGKPHTLFLIPL
ncbi:hypothetical protein D9M72_476690 [compost metagenome]